MTVAELIETLEGMDQNLPVFFQIGADEWFGGFAPSESEGPEGQPAVIL